MYHEESYSSNDSEIENRGYYIEDVPVDEDDAPEAYESEETDNLNEEDE